ncbi:MAG: methyl-accepting chemotaxis protein [Cellvibrionaceae bacterium]
MNFYNNMKLGPKLASGFAIILLMMAGVSAVVYTNVNALVSSSKWVNHTYKVIINANAVGAAMVDMETGQRGFMITGDDEFLDPYFSGKERFDILIKKGKKLTSDNAAQVKRWQTVADLKERWLNEAAEPEISARREVTQGAEAIATFKQISSRTVGKDIFDSIRAALADIENKLGRNKDGQHLVTQVTLALVNMETGQRGFLLSGKEESLEPYIQGSKDLTRYLAQLKKKIKGTNVRQSDLRRVQSRVDAWMEKAAEPEINARREMNKYATTIDDISNMMASGSGKSIMDTLRVELQKIIDAEETLIKQRSAEQENTSESTISVSILGTLMALIVGGVIAWLNIRGILGPLKATNAILDDIAQGDGDLTIRVPVTNTDEIGDLATSFNTFVDKLQDIIRQMVSVTSELSNSASSMAAITEQTSVAIRTQGDETQMVASAITEMAATSQEVASNAEGASAAANDADDEAKNGNKIVSDTISSINLLAGEVEASSEVIAKVRGDSENIGAVLDVIKGVAEQTNLLALNAAIEAARAGEQGRGFAVVADEVRTLAQRTQDSATEIENLIETLQSGAEKAVDSMGQSRERVLATVGQATHAGESLTSITTAVETISQMNTQIATAAEEQTAVSDEISQNIVNIQEMSNQTASGSEQIAQASEKLASLSQQLDNLIGQFKV